MASRLARLLSDLARSYVLIAPVAHGKGLVVRAARHLPADAREFVYERPSGSIVLRWDDAVARMMLRNDGYETTEVESFASLVEPGAVVFDVGANVGLLTVPLARAVGENGRVIAIEPMRENSARLQQNLARNEIANVTVFDVAAAASDGVAVMNLSSDFAFASFDPRRGGKQRRVPVHRLDTIWKELGEPAVAFVKIDVERAQIDVIDGANELIRSCRPILLVEALDPQAAEMLRARLASEGYERVTPAGYSRQNHLFRSA